MKRRAYSLQGFPLHCTCLMGHWAKSHHLQNLHHTKNMFWFMVNAVNCRARQYISWDERKCMTMDMFRYPFYRHFSKTLAVTWLTKVFNDIWLPQSFANRSPHANRASINRHSQTRCWQSQAMTVVAFISLIERNHDQKCSSMTSFHKEHKMLTSKKEIIGNRN